MELETQFQIAHNLGFLNEVEITRLLKSCAELGRILNGLLSSVSKAA